MTSYRTATDIDTGEEFYNDPISGEWKPMPSTGRGVASSIGQGATLGFSDEIAAALAAGGAKIGGDPKPFGDIYGDIKQAEQSRQREFETVNPGATLGSEFGGGIGTSILAAPRMAASQFYQKSPYLSSVATGAGTGSIMGAGQAETLQDVPQGMLIGGGTGAVLGPLGQWGSEKLTRGITSLIGGVTRPFVSAKELARKKTLEALTRDNLEPAEALTRMREYGPDSRLVDVSENLLGLSEAAAILPGRAKVSAQKLAERAAGKSERLMSDMRRITGKSGRFIGPFHELIKSRGKQVAPLYEKAYSTDITDPASMARGLKDMLEVGGVTAKGDSFQALSNSRFGREVNKVLKSLYKGKGKDKVLKTNIGEIDLVLKELRDKIGSAYRSGNTERVRFLTEAKNRVQGVLEAESPHYKRALKIYSSESSVKDAMQSGKKVFMADTELTDDLIKGMSHAERDGFLVGAASAIRDKINKVTDKGNAALRLAGSPELREKLRFAFKSEEDFKEFMGAVAREERFSDVTNKLLNNSRTALKQEAERDLASDAVDITLMGPGYVIARRVKDFLSRRTDVPEEMRDELSKILLEAGPDEAVKYLKGLRLPKRSFDEIVRTIGSAVNMVSSERAASTMTDWME